MDRHRCRQARVCLVLVLAGITGSSGCVKRRYTIRTDPPGALVIVNGEELGASPASRSFVYYGGREVTVMLDGYKTQTIIQPINAPWWDNYLTEFITENAIPYTFRDDREFTYKLVPSDIPTSNDLLDRAQGLRSQALTNPPPLRGGILGYFGFP